MFGYEDELRHKIEKLEKENEKLRAVVEKARSAIKNIEENYLGLTIALDHLDDLDKALEALDE